LDVKLDRPAAAVAAHLLEDPTIAGKELLVDRDPMLDITTLDVHGIFSGEQRIVQLRPHARRFGPRP
jgi:hypothetical protein